MCDQITECNPHWHIRSNQSTIRGCTVLHLILYSIQSITTDRRWAMSHSNTPPVRNRAPLTTRSSSLRCVSAAEHHTAEHYSKTGRTKQRKLLPRSDLSWNTRQDFLKIPSLWEATLETEQRLINFSPHCIDICSTKVVFFSDDVFPFSVFIKNLIYCWSPILSFFSGLQLILLP